MRTVELPLRLPGRPPMCFDDESIPQSPHELNSIILPQPRQTMSLLPILPKNPLSQSTPPPLLPLEKPQLDDCMMDEDISGSYATTDVGPTPSTTTHGQSTTTNGQCTTRMLSYDGTRGDGVFNKGNSSVFIPFLGSRQPGLPFVGEINDSVSQTADMNGRPRPATMMDQSRDIFLPFLPSRQAHASQTIDASGSTTGLLLPISTLQSHGTTITTPLSLPGIGQGTSTEQSITGRGTIFDSRASPYSGKMIGAFPMDDEFKDPRTGKTHRPVYLQRPVHDEDNVPTKIGYLTRRATSQSRPLAGWLSSRFKDGPVGDDRRVSSTNRPFSKRRSSVPSMAINPSGPAQLPTYNEDGTAKYHRSSKKGTRLRRNTECIGNDNVGWKSPKALASPWEMVRSPRIGQRKQSTARSRAASQDRSFVRERCCRKKPIEGNSEGPAEPRDLFHSERKSTPRAGRNIIVSEQSSVTDTSAAEMSPQGPLIRAARSSSFYDGAKSSAGTLGNQQQIRCDRRHQTYNESSWMGGQLTRTGTWRRNCHGSPRQDVKPLLMQLQSSGSNSIWSVLAGRDCGKVPRDDLYRETTPMSLTSWGEPQSIDRSCASDYNKHFNPLVGHLHTFEEEPSSRESFVEGWENPGETVSTTNCAEASEALRLGQPKVSRAVNPRVAPDALGHSSIYGPRLTETLPADWGRAGTGLDPYCESPASTAATCSLNVASGQWADEQGGTIVFHPVSADPADRTRQYVDQSVSFDVWPDGQCQPAKICNGSPEDSSDSSDEVQMGTSGARDSDLISDASVSGYSPSALLAEGLGNEQCRIECHPFPSSAIEDGGTGSNRSSGSPMSYAAMLAARATMFSTLSCSSTELAKAVAIDHPFPSSPLTRDGESAVNIQSRVPLLTHMVARENLPLLPRVENHYAIAASRRDEGGDNTDEGQQTPCDMLVLASGVTPNSCLTPLPLSMVSGMKAATISDQSPCMTPMASTQHIQNRRGIHAVGRKRRVSIGEWAHLQSQRYQPPSMGKHPMKSNLVQSRSPCKVLSPSKRYIRRLSTIVSQAGAGKGEATPEGFSGETASQPGEELEESEEHSASAGRKLIDCRSSATLDSGKSEKQSKRTTRVGFDFSQQLATIHAKHKGKNRQRTLETEFRKVFRKQPLLMEVFCHLFDLATESKESAHDDEISDNVSISNDTSEKKLKSKSVCSTVPSELTGCHSCPSFDAEGHLDEPKEYGGPGEPSPKVAQKLPGILPRSSPPFTDDVGFQSEFLSSEIPSLEELNIAYVKIYATLLALPDLGATGNKICYERVEKLTDPGQPLVVLRAELLACLNDPVIDHLVEQNRASVNSVSNGSAEAEIHDEIKAFAPDIVETMISTKKLLQTPWNSEDLRILHRVLFPHLYSEYGDWRTEVAARSKSNRRRSRKTDWAEHSDEADEGTSQTRPSQSDLSSWESASCETDSTGYDGNSSGRFSPRTRCSSSVEQCTGNGSESIESEKDSLDDELEFPASPTADQLANVLNINSKAHSVLHVYQGIYVYRVDCFEDFYTMGKTLGSGGEGQVRICIPSQIVKCLDIDPLSIDWDKAKSNHHGPQGLAGMLGVSEERAAEVTKLMADSGGFHPRHFAYAVKVTARQQWNSELDVYSMAHFLGALRHPNVLNYRAFYEDDNNYFFLMDLADGPELLGYLTAMDDVTEVQCREIMKQILSALAYIHGENLIHRDIKPENFVCADRLSDNGDHGGSDSGEDSSREDDTDTENSDARTEGTSRRKRRREKGGVPRLLLIDFGLACYSQDAASICPDGTPMYMAPELFLRSMNKPPYQYDQKIDVWAAGVILCQLLTGRTPFDEQGPAALLERVKRSDLFDDMGVRRDGFRETNFLSVESADEASDDFELMFQRLVTGVDSSEKKGEEELDRSPLSAEEHDSSSASPSLAHSRSSINAPLHEDSILESPRRAHLISDYGQHQSRSPHIHSSSRCMASASFDSAHQTYVSRASLEDLTEQRNSDFTGPSNLRLTGYALKRQPTSLFRRGCLRLAINRGTPQNGHPLPGIHHLKRRTSVTCFPATYPLKRYELESSEQHKQKPRSRTCSDIPKMAGSASIGNPSVLSANCSGTERRGVCFAAPSQEQTPESPSLMRGKRGRSKSVCWDTTIPESALDGLAAAYEADPSQNFYKLNFETDGAEWGHVSEEAKDLVRLLLSLDPQKRPTAQEALEHSWFTGKPSYEMKGCRSPPPPPAGTPQFWSSIQRNGGGANFGLDLSDHSMGDSGPAGRGSLEFGSGESLGPKRMEFSVTAQNVTELLAGNSDTNSLIQPQRHTYVLCDTVNAQPISFAGWDLGPHDSPFSELSRLTPADETKGAARPDLTESIDSVRWCHMRASTHGHDELHSASPWSTPSMENKGHSLYDLFQRSDDGAAAAATGEGLAGGSMSITAECLATRQYDCSEASRQRAVSLEDVHSKDFRLLPSEIQDARGRQNSMDVGNEGHDAEIRRIPQAVRERWKLFIRDDASPARTMNAGTQRKHQVCISPKRALRSGIEYQGAAIGCTALQHPQAQIMNLSRCGGQPEQPHAARLLAQSPKATFSSHAAFV